MSSNSIISGCSSGSNSNISCGSNIGSSSSNAGSSSSSKTSGGSSNISGSSSNISETKIVNTKPR